MGTARFNIRPRGQGGFFESHTVDIRDRTCIRGLHPLTSFWTGQVPCPWPATFIPEGRDSKTRPGSKRGTPARFSSGPVLLIRPGRPAGLCPGFVPKLMGQKKPDANESGQPGGERRRGPPLEKKPGVVPSGGRREAGRSPRRGPGTGLKKKRKGRATQAPVPDGPIGDPFATPLGGRMAGGKGKAMARAKGAVRPKLGEKERWLAVTSWRARGFLLVSFLIGTGGVLPGPLLEGKLPGKDKPSAGCPLITRPKHRDDLPAQDGRGGLAPAGGQRAPPSPKGGQGGEGQCGVKVKKGRWSPGLQGVEKPGLRTRSDEG